jgi:uncharacterized protein
LLEVVCVNLDTPAPIRRWLQACLLTVLLLMPMAPAMAVSATAFSDTIPQERVLDQADVLSRAASADVARQLEILTTERVDAHLITLKQLDYGLTLNQLVASPSLSGRLSANLLRSTARTTMTAPIRDGARFRQASLDGIERITTVLQGGEDPGEPAVAQVITPSSNVPSREQTESSNGFTWVVVLLVVGTVVPMATWWVFSR